MALILLFVFGLRGGCRLGSCFDFLFAVNGGGDATGAVMSMAVEGSASRFARPSHTAAGHDSRQSMWLAALQPGRLALVAAREVTL